MFCRSSKYYECIYSSLSIIFDLILVILVYFQNEVTNYPYVMVSQVSREIFYSIPIIVTVLIIGLVLLKYLPNYIRYILGFLCIAVAFFYFITTLNAIKGSNGFEYCCNANTTTIDGKITTNYTIASDCKFMYDDVNVCTSKDAFNHIYNKDYDMILVLFHLAAFVFSYISVLIIPKKIVVKQEQTVKTKEEKEKEDLILHKHIEEKKIKYYSFIGLQFLSVFIAFGGEVYLYILKNSTGYHLISNSLLAIYVVYTIYLFFMTMINTFCTSWNCLEGIDILIYIVVIIDLIICSGDNLMNFKDTYNSCCLNSQSLINDEKCKFLSVDDCSSYLAFVNDSKSYMTIPVVITFIGLIGSSLVFTLLSYVNYVQLNNYQGINGKKYKILNENEL